LAKQIAREPIDSLLSSSSTTTGTPCCARSIAMVRPTGPAPTTTTGWRTGTRADWSDDFPNANSSF